jgi:hypothetical protein
MVIGTIDEDDAYGRILKRLCGGNAAKSSSDNYNLGRVTGSNHRSRLCHINRFEHHNFLSVPCLGFGIIKNLARATFFGSCLR